MTDAAPPGHCPVVSTETAVAHTLAPAAAVACATLDPIALPVRTEARARSFRALYDAHVDFVWRNLRRLGVQLADAEDRSQEVFVVAHRRFDEFEDRGHGPRAWLFQILLRVASDARRHRRRHPEDPDGGDATSRASVAPTQTETVARREALSQLDTALETIDVGRRAVLVLHEIEEMTAPEIAQVLGIPLNTVYSRLRVARAELEAALARPGTGP
ncbi:MAG: RNA polymerase sigma factor [Myxococcota bacterium]|nr:RNA polymerase sigma factor [Myxococcota bacterium]